MSNLIRLKPGSNRVAGNVEREDMARGTGPSGAWNALERMELLGPLPHAPVTEFEIERQAPYARDR